MVIPGNLLAKPGNGNPPHYDLSVGLVQRLLGSINTFLSIP
jgi:hypothetical protein